MVDFDFTNISVTNEELKLLKKLKGRKKVRYSDQYRSLLMFPNHFAEYIRFTVDDFGNQIPVKDYIRISELGEAFLKYHADKIFQRNLPVKIALCSLVLSVISTVVTIYQLLCG